MKPTYLYLKEVIAMWTGLSAADERSSRRPAQFETKFDYVFVL